VSQNPPDINSISVESIACVDYSVEAPGTTAALSLQRRRFFSSSRTLRRTNSATKTLIPTMTMLPPMASQPTGYIRISRRIGCMSCSPRLWWRQARIACRAGH
jgi:hypothetical protein